MYVITTILNAYKNMIKSHKIYYTHSISKIDFPMIYGTYSKEILTISFGKHKAHDLHATVHTPSLMNTTITCHTHTTITLVSITGKKIRAWVYSTFPHQLNKYK